MTEVQRFEHNGFDVVIMSDDSPENPRQEFDCLGKILHTSWRYNLGDERVEVEEINNIIKDDDMIVFPVFAYIHGGVALSLGGFADRFDSGQSGIIYCSKEDAKEQFPNSSGNELRENVKKAFAAEIEVFSQYLNGEVYGYRIESHLGEEDSCWGFFGIETVIEAAKEAADYCTKYQACAEEGPSCDAEGQEAC